MRNKVHIANDTKRENIGIQREKNDTHDRITQDHAFPLFSWSCSGFTVQFRRNTLAHPLTGIYPAIPARKSISILILQIIHFPIPEQTLSIALVKNHVRLAEAVLCRLMFRQLHSDFDGNIDTPVTAAS